MQRHERETILGGRMLFVRTSLKSKVWFFVRISPNPPQEVEGLSVQQWKMTLVTHFLFFLLLFLIFLINFVLSIITIITVVSIISIISTSVVTLSISIITASISFASIGTTVLWKRNTYLQKWTILRYIADNFRKLAMIFCVHLPYPILEWMSIWLGRISPHLLARKFYISITIMSMFMFIFIQQWIVIQACRCVYRPLKTRTYILCVYSLSSISYISLPV